MIVKVNYNDIKGTALKGVKDGKEYKVFMRVAVDESNIEKAIKELNKSKWVIGFDYSGSVEFLQGIDINGAVVFIHFNIDDIDGNFDGIDFLMHSIRNDVRVVINVDSMFSDMRLVEEWSSRFSNIRFCGGHLIRLKGCNIGCVGVQDIPKKIAESRIPMVCKGCSCVLTNVLLDDLDYIEFYEDLGLSTLSSKKSSGRRSSKKELISSLLVSVEEDNF